jgi:hypothetical protein
VITESTDVFPNNVVSLIKTRLALLDSDLQIFRRPLRTSDPLQCVGIFASQWLPDEESYEMDNQPIGSNEPTIQRYLISIQAYVKDGDEERGLAIHAILSKMIRAVLYADEPLRVGLSMLGTTVLGTTEHTKRWGIQTQRFYSNEISGSWLYLSTLDFWVETETM